MHRWSIFRQSPTGWSPLFTKARKPYRFRTFGGALRAWDKLGLDSSTHCINTL